MPDVTTSPFKVLYRHPTIFHVFCLRLWLDRPVPDVKAAIRNQLAQWKLSAAPFKMKWGEAEMFDGEWEGEDLILKVRYNRNRKANQFRCVFTAEGNNTVMELRTYRTEAQKMLQRVLIGILFSAVILTGYAVVFLGQLQVLIPAVMLLIGLSAAGWVSRGLYEAAIRRFVAASVA